MKNRKKDNYGGAIVSKTLTRFIITVIVYFIGLFLLLLVAVEFLSLFTWYPEDPLYRIFNFIHSNLFTFLVIAGIVGIIGCFLYYGSKILGYIDAIIAASAQLVENDNQVIALPKALKEVELRLNLAKQERLRNAQLAKEAEQRKNDLIVYLAHDIKTPLTSVIGYLNLLDEASDMPKKQRAKYVGISLEKANRLESLIDEFFEITRYNFQTIQLYKKDIDLNYMLVQLVEEFYPSLSSHEKQVKVNIDEDVTIYADPDKIARVFNNIMKNAIAYSEPNSTITITVHQLESSTIIDFRNPGSIPKDKLESIFERFFRLDTARSSDSGGAGLGLAIAKEIVEQHHGKISAFSDELSTTFTVELPKLK